jgi:hypothetical protein
VPSCVRALRHKAARAVAARRGPRTSSRIQIGDELGNPYGFIIATNVSAAALTIRELLRRLDLELDDDDDDADDDDMASWTEWLVESPPETRYAASFGLNGTHTILDIDHVDRASMDLVKQSHGISMAGWTLVQPEPGLGAVRWATREELLACYETEQPTEVGGDEWFDALERGHAIAIVRWQDARPVEIVFCGVTGD